MQMIIKTTLYPVKLPQHGSAAALRYPITPCEFPSCRAWLGSISLARAQLERIWPSGLQTHSPLTSCLPQTGPAQHKRYLNAKHFGMLLRISFVHLMSSVWLIVTRNRELLHVVCAQYIQVKCTYIANEGIGFSGILGFFVNSPKWHCVCVCVLAHAHIFCGGVAVQ